jgi:Ran GTPase-activating protein (RanGAP) involved in mRNA processing and transport
VLSGHAARCTQINLSANQFCGLDLNGWGTYSAADIKVIAQSIAVSRSLSSIDISGNHISDDGARALASAISSATSTSTLHALRCDALDLNAEMTSLDLSNKDLGPADVELVAAALNRFMASVTSIDVAGNRITQEVALVLLGALKGKEMVRIGMAQCSLGGDGAEAVAELVSSSRSLTQVLA